MLLQGEASAAFRSPCRSAHGSPASAAAAGGTADAGAPACPAPALLVSSPATRLRLCHCTQVTKATCCTRSWPSGARCAAAPGPASHSCVCVRKHACPPSRAADRQAPWGLPALGGTFVWQHAAAGRLCRSSTCALPDPGSPAPLAATNRVSMRVRACAGPGAPLVCLLGAAPDAEGPASVAASRHTGPGGRSPPDASCSRAGLHSRSLFCFAHGSIQRAWSTQRAPLPPPPPHRTATASGCCKARGGPIALRACRMAPPPAPCPSACNNKRPSHKRQCPKPQAPAAAPPTTPPTAPCAPLPAPRTRH